MKADATFGVEGRYRYDLTRPVTTRAAGEALRLLLWIMLNPSVAGAEKDDLTVKKCVGFSAQFGFHALVIVNLFALVSTNPDGLFTAADPIGPENDAYIDRHVAEADQIIVAWGDSIEWNSRSLPAAMRDRHKRVLARLSGKDVRHLGTLTRGGMPRHPSRIGYDSPLRPFPLQ